MRPVAVFLSGLMAALTGAFIRSCENGISDAFAHAWCGKAPLQFAQAHEHCAGCALTAAGLGLIALSPLLLARTPRVVAAKR